MPLLGPEFRWCFILRDWNGVYKNMGSAGHFPGGGCFNEIQMALENWFLVLGF